MGSGGGALGGGGRLSAIEPVGVGLCTGERAVRSRAMGIKVGVFGAGGRMGSTVCQAVRDDPDLDLVAAVDPHYSGLDLRTVTGVDADLRLARDRGILERAGVEVAVDFTERHAASDNLSWLAANGIHGVVGTTGFTDDDIARFETEFTSSNCVIAPNFAIGAVLMMHFAALAAPYFDSAEVIELHHENKVDAPSGTAMLTVQRMAAASADWSFMPGVLLAVKQVGSRPGVTVGLDALLGL